MQAVTSTEHWTAPDKRSSKGIPVAGPIELASLGAVRSEALNGELWLIFMMCSSVFDMLKMERGNHIVAVCSNRSGFEVSRVP